MANEIITTKEYRDWLIDIKRRVQSAQLKAATAVNTALLEFYWSLGADITERGYAHDSGCEVVTRHNTLGIQLL